MALASPPARARVGVAAVSLNHGHSLTTTKAVITHKVGKSEAVEIEPGGSGEKRIMTSEGYH